MFGTQHSRVAFPARGCSYFIFTRIRWAMLQLSSQVQLNSCMQEPLYTFMSFVLSNTSSPISAFFAQQLRRIAVQLQSVAHLSFKRSSITFLASCSIRQSATRFRRPSFIRWRVMMVVAVSKVASIGRVRIFGTDIRMSDDWAISIASFRARSEISPSSLAWSFQAKRLNEPLVCCELWSLRRRPRVSLTKSADRQSLHVCDFFVMLSAIGSPF